MAHSGATPRGSDARLTTVGLLFEASAGLRRLFHRQMEEAGPGGQSFDVLIRLARTAGNELRMSELAAQTSLTPSGLTRAIDRLQRQGLVSRRTCPEDRRGSFAQLTPEGRATMDRLIPEHMAHIDALLDEVYTVEEEAQLEALLRRMRDHVLARNLELGAACEGGPEPCPAAD